MTVEERTPFLFSLNDFSWIKLYLVQMTGPGRTTFTPTVAPTFEAKSLHVPKLKILNLFFASHIFFMCYTCVLANQIEHLLSLHQRKI